MSLIPADNYNYTKDIKKEHIWDYYDSLKESMAPFLEDTSLVLKSKNNSKSLHIKDISFLNSEDMGENIEIHIKSSPSDQNKIVFNLEPGKDVIWGDIKRSVLQFHDFLKDTKLFGKVTIYFSGDNSFSVWGDLKKKGNSLNKIKKEWEDILDEKFQKDSFWVINSNPKSSQVNIETASLKKEGTYLVPYTVNKETGLVISSVSPENILKFKKSDNTLDKVYSSTLKKPFSWGVKRACDHYRVAFMYLERK